MLRWKKWQYFKCHRLLFPCRKDTLETSLLGLFDKQTEFSMVKNRYFSDRSSMSSVGKGILRKKSNWLEIFWFRK